MWAIFFNYMREEDVFQRVYNDILFQWSVYEWGFDFDRAQLSYYYYAMFLLRRWIFGIVPFLIPQLQSARIAALFIINLWYTLDYFSQGVQPSKTRRRLEMLNEVVFGILIYHMIIFSDLNPSPTSTFAMGYSFIAGVIAMILVNIYVTLKVALDKYKRLLEQRFKVQAHMQTRSSILWMLSSKGRLGNSSARKYESFKAKAESN
mmetsp:Transcript_2700/g.4221  ORF Transcript_2700/g.4221 Transcript_2700/m.4221 type:complete len:205 (+) Transcript_2700:6290-6904(+)